MTSLSNAFINTEVNATGLKSLSFFGDIFFANGTAIDSFHIPLLKMQFIQSFLSQLLVAVRRCFIVTHLTTGETENTWGLRRPYIPLQRRVQQVICCTFSAATHTHNIIQGLFSLALLACSAKYPLSSHRTEWCAFCSCHPEIRENRQVVIEQESVMMKEYLWGFFVFCFLIACPRAEHKRTGSVLARWLSGSMFRMPLIYSNNKSVLM